MKKLILFLLFGIFLVSLVGAECYGGADLDINKIERTPGQSTFKIIATANQAGDCLKIAWTQNDLNALLNKESPDELTDKDIMGDLIITSQKDIFNTITDSSKKIYEYEIYNHGWTLSSCNLQSCSDWDYPTTEFAVRTFSWPGPCYCIYTSQNSIATFGQFSGVKDRNGEAIISISGLNSKTINFGDSDGTIDIDNKVTVSWRGDLLGGHWLGTPGYKVFKDSGGMYYLTSEEYNNVKNVLIDANGNYDMTVRKCLGEEQGWEIGGITEAQNCVNAYNQKLDELLVDKKPEYLSSDEIIKSATFIGSDFVVEEEPYSTSFPQFTLTFDAEWVGVHWITGQPKVSCPEGMSFVSGETKSLDFNIENVADEKGAFSLSLDCGELSATLSKNKVLLDSGKSEMVNVQVTYSTDTNKKVKCNLGAYATRDMTKSDECSFDIEVEPRLGDNINQSSIPPITGGTTGASKTTGTIILIVFLVLIGGSITYYFYTNKKKTTLKKGVKKELETKGKHCTKCGSLLKPQSKFCSKCGEGIKLRGK